MAQNQKRFKYIFSNKKKKKKLSSSSEGGKDECDPQLENCMHWKSIIDIEFTTEMWEKYSWDMMRIEHWFCLKGSAKDD